MRHTRLALILAIVSAPLAGPPARASTFVPPCGSACTPSVVDGDVGTLEYGGGVTYPLSNFGGNTPNGEARLQLDGEVLQVGLRLPAPAATASQRGSISVRLDADRLTTTCAPVAESPGAEDRILDLNYDLSDTSLTVGQRVGNGAGWVPPTGPQPWLKLWQVDAALSVPAGDPGMFHVELTIRLRPDGAQTSEVITDGVLGFSLVNSAQGSFEHMPGAFGMAPPPDKPCTWETLVFSLPPATHLSVSTWSIGQGPGLAEDEGEGEPDDVAASVFNHDIVCLNEIGSDGDQEDLIDRVNAHRDDVNLPPINPVTFAWEFENGHAYHESPNLILSRFPVIDSGVFLLDSDTYYIPDHVIWARVLTSAAVPTRGALKAGEFIDVYCTALHTDDSEETNLLLEAVRSIVDTTRAPDRPALLLGKLGVVAGGQDYQDMLSILGIDALSPFDQANSWLDDTYDLGTLDPFGRGTDLGAACWWDPTDPDPRTTYALALPALDTWPTFGVASGPTVSIDNHEINVGHNECISGHAEVLVDMALTRVDQPGHYNPLKTHRLTYKIATLEDHATGGCCADWFTPAIGWTGGFPMFFSDADTPDGDIVQPGWHATIDLTIGSTTATAQVWEWDTSNDHYDVTSDANTADLDAFFRVTDASGLVERVSSGGATLDNLGTLEQSPGGFVTTTTGTSGETATSVHVITAEEL